MLVYINLVVNSVLFRLRVMPETSLDLNNSRNLIFAIDLHSLSILDIKVTFFVVKSSYICAK